MTYSIREVNITISYNPDATDVRALVSDILDIYGVEGTFVPNQKGNDHGA